MAEARVAAAVAAVAPAVSGFGKGENVAPARFLAPEM